MRFSVLFFLLVWMVTAAPSRVEFNRDIRPILSDRCFHCHGPDEQKRKSKLRLDTEQGAFADLGGGRKAIVPGKPDQSELIRRITSEHKAMRMPPVASKIELRADEIDLLNRWIEEGAEWQGHWSFVAPTRPPLPTVEHQSIVRNEIDRFVLAKLERQGLTLSPEASKERLIRRVTLDLTGLPPAPEEVEAFLADRSANAYEKVVDRLLNSPRYGERMAAPWLAAARYADTNGYQTDGERFMWRWRDWVIDAFNQNKPFDQFTIEQIAGDMLPNATLDQQIASGFNRNHRGNGEGGIIGEEYAVEYVVDRVDTTATVFMGLTMGCARCHDHKYDPVTQKEFYRMFAYFNNVPERGRAFKYGNSPPYIPAPTAEQQRKLDEIERRLHAAHSQFEALATDIAKARKKWEKSVRGKGASQYSLADDLLVYVPGADQISNQADGKQPEVTVKDGGVPAAAGAPVPASRFDGKAYLDVGDTAPLDFRQRFSMAAWIRPESPDGAIVTRAEDKEEGSGYGLYLREGKLQVNLVLRWLDDCLRLESEQPLPLNEWRHVAMTYDGTRLASGVRVFVDGKPFPMKVLVDEMNQPFHVKEPVRIGAGNGLRFLGGIGEVRIYEENLTPEQVAVLAAPEPIEAIAAIPPEKRTHGQQHKLESYFQEHAAPSEIQEAYRRLRAVRRERTKFIDALPTVMVMKEMEDRRDTHLLLRGAYDQPADKVEPGVPSILPPLPEGVPNNRLGFAQWLVSPGNPLTARVTVNRFWQMYFGTGIVRTVEDFGSQGEWPSHPDLLDWLAVEFIESGWDMKALQKKIVMSGTYRQSSRVTPELNQRDPENRILARGPRIRLEPEMVRDQALAASGLLVERIGGPSVKPYQPKGLWSELSGGADYQEDTGEALYRRSLYTFWKRAAPPPSMINFDATSHEACTVRQPRTNTPLQALNLMNDVTYVEAARKIAERMMRAADNPLERIAYGFRLITARQPNPAEADVLLDHYRFSRDRFLTDTQAAQKLLAAGEAPCDPDLPAAELASYANVASLILNMDEAITKE